jgi:hypothetical protein
MHRLQFFDSAYSETYHIKGLTMLPTKAIHLLQNLKVEYMCVLDKLVHITYVVLKETIYRSTVCYCENYACVKLTHFE